ncbi:MAG TPA: PPC domain-containing DNA-binding protein [Chloroflexota bacterium]
MKAELIDDASEKTYALIFEPGDDVIAGLLDIAHRHHLAGSHFTAIGGFSRVVLGYFEWTEKRYRPIPIEEQVEVLMLAGDIALRDDGEPMVHAHVVVATSDALAHGGHLLEATVWPTLEVILVESPVHLHRTFDADVGAALIRLPDDAES